MLLAANRAHIPHPLPNKSPLKLNLREVMERNPPRPGASRRGPMVLEGDDGEQVILSGDKDKSGGEK